ncbi:RIP metalloprotease RseP [Bacteroidetes/Chlorobi group bacterium Naka2016]|jgi:regulator of sigma E protease|nr:MAG: RIP metalloprotease RseP [Bacteroidetes/Chlorobi group bacterium Naka2016]
MEFLSNILYFVIVIGILVIVHEFGHFIAAKLSGIRVDAFSIGMGPRLFGFNKVNGFTFGKLPDDFELNGFCDYRVCLLPIGGYVKIAGMIDESLDKSFINTPPKEYEFRSKGTLAKLFVITAGVIMNFLLAVLIFSIISFSEGKVVWKTNKIGYVQNNSVAESIGLKPGDVILSINNKTVDNWNDIITRLSLDKFGATKKITILRGSDTLTLSVDGDKIVKSIAKGNMNLGLTPEKFYVFVRDVETLAPAGKLGLKSGDTLLAINNEKIDAFDELTYLLSLKKSKPILLQWKRGNQILADSVVPTADGKLGFYPGFHFAGRKDTLYYGVFEALGNGVKETIRSTELFFSSIAQIFKGNISAKESIGGPIMIAKSASQQASLGVVYFLNFIALLSVTLAIINILPLPALDGGHLIIILIEGIIRKELPVKAKLIIQNIGIGLIVLLMIFVIFNDVSRLIK